MNMNSKEWFEGALKEAEPYIRKTAWREAEIVAVIADIQGCLKFGVIKPTEALNRLNALWEQDAEIMRIVDGQSVWLKNFTSDLLNQTKKETPVSAGATAA